MEAAVAVRVRLAVDPVLLLVALVQLVAAPVLPVAVLEHPAAGLPLQRVLLPHLEVKALPAVQPEAEVLRAAQEAQVLLPVVVLRKEDWLLPVKELRKP